MLEAHGLLELTMRSESYRAQAQLLSHNNAHYAGNKSNDATAMASSGSAGSGGVKSAITLPKGATAGPMKEFWQRATDKAAENVPSADTMKKLQDASKSDNKEIAAQKMQQAKSKLQSLRLQAQLAAASGDKQQLRRLAQEVAAAAREVAAAAHDLAGGVVNSVSGDGTSVPLTTASGDRAAAGETNGTGDADQADPAAAAGAASTETIDRRAGTTAPAPVATAKPGATHEATSAAASGGAETGTSAGQATDTDPLGTALKTKATGENAPLYAQDAPKDGDKLAWGQKALNSLSTDANSALSQARGLLAFIASLVRAKRKSGEGNEDDRFFNELQRTVDDAQASVNHDISAASQQLVADQTEAADASAGESAGDGSSLFGIESVTVTQVTTTAVFLNITT